MSLAVLACLVIAGRRHELLPKRREDQVAG